jgi:Polyketide cyclase / dehydrase and lipid transport
MAKVQSVITIERPPEEVFGYFMALDENVPRTNPDVEYVVKTSSGESGVGTTFRSRGRALGKVRDTTMRFTRVVPNREIGFEAEVGPMRPTGLFRFDPAERGTRVTFRGDPNPVGLFKVATPIFVRIGRRVWRERLARAKATLEGSGSSSTN